MTGLHAFRVPTGTGRHGKWESIYQSGKSQGILIRLEKSRNFTQNAGNVPEIHVI